MIYVGFEERRPAGPNLLIRGQYKVFCFEQLGFGAVWRFYEALKFPR